MKGKIWMVSILVLISFLSAALLSGVGNYTAPLIAKNKETAKNIAVLRVIGIPADKENAEELFTEHVKKDSLGNYHYFTSGELTVIEMSGNGFWDKITVLMALGADLETIKGFTVLEQVETPGLGARIEEEGFQKSFIGKKVRPFFAIVKRAEGINEIDALTGATETSKSLSKLINNGVQNFYEIIGH